MDYSPNMEYSSSQTVNLNAARDKFCSQQKGFSDNCPVAVLNPDSRFTYPSMLDFNFPVEFTLVFRTINLNSFFTLIS